MASKSTSKRYLNENDIIMRLDNCLVMYKKVPYLCKYMGNEFVCLYDLTDLTEPAMENIDPNSEDLDISSIHIGYANYTRRCLFITRAPHRKQKQGTSTNNTHYIIIKSDSSAVLIAAPAEILFCKGVKDAILGNYPPVKKIYEKILDKKTKISGAAFSPDYAIICTEKEAILEGTSLPPKEPWTARLYHQAIEIGEITAGDRAKLFEEYNNSLHIWNLSAFGIFVE